MESAKLNVRHWKHHHTLPKVQGRKIPRSDFLEQVKFAPGKVKMEVWWFSGQVKLASEVFLAIISH